MKLEPANGVNLFNTGILYNIKSNHTKAVEMLEESIAQNKDNIHAYLALGDAYERQNEIKKALGVYRDLMSQGVAV